MSDRAITIRWVLGASLAIAAVVLLTAAVGSSMPGEYTAVRSASFRQNPEVLWKLFTDAGAGPCWRTDLQRVEEVCDASGHALVREVYRNGRTITLETLESVPPRRLVRRICDADGFVTGCWSAEIVATPDGSRLTLTERGSIANPFARLAFRLLVDPAESLDRTLRMAGERLGEQPAIVR
jgi:hypothetical protein